MLMLGRGRGKEEREEERRVGLVGESEAKRGVWRVRLEVDPLPSKPIRRSLPMRRQVPGLSPGKVRVDRRIIKQRTRPQLGHQPLTLHQRPPIKALMRDPIRHLPSQLPEQPRERRRKLLRRSRQVVEISIDLGLDVEQHRFVRRASDKVKQFRQGGQFGSRDGDLEREPIESERTAVEGLELGEGEVGDVLSDVGEERVVGEGRGGVEAFEWVDGFVVPDDQVTVFGETGVHFEGGDAVDEPVGERGEGRFDKVLGRKGAKAAKGIESALVFHSS